MTSDLVQRLRERSLLVSGGAAEARAACVEALRTGWRRPGKTGVFVLKEGLKSDDAFLAELARSLPLTSPLGIAGSEMSLDQINDYWLEWPHESGYDSALIVWPEAHGFIAKERGMFAVHLAHLLGSQNRYHVAGKPELRFVVTSRDEIPLEVDERRIAVEGRKARTLAQLVEAVALD